MSINTSVRRRVRADRSSRSTMLAIVFVVGLILASFAASVATAGTTLGAIVGDVEIGSGDPAIWRQARSGEDLAPGDRVRTGSDGRAEVRMSAGTLRIHENSMLRLPEAGTAEDRVELEEGYSLFNVLRRMRSRFEVHTPTVVVSVKGTVFGVDVGEAVSEVAVYEGLVGVRDPGADEAIETLVREGFAAVGGGGLPFEIDLAPGGDPWLDWSDPALRPSSRSERVRPSDHVDRVRDQALRRTDADVIREALKRRPELADRLQRLDDREDDRPGRVLGNRVRRNRRAGDGPGGGDDSHRADDVGPDHDDGLPAALDLSERDTGPRRMLDRIGSENERERGRRLGEEIEQRVREAGDRTVDGERPIESIDLEDLEMNATGPSTQNDPMGVSLEDLEGLESDAIAALVRSLQQARDDLMSGSGEDVSEDDFWDAAEANLILNGMDMSAAEDLIDRLSED